MAEKLDRLAERNMAVSSPAIGLGAYVGVSLKRGWRIQACSVWFMLWGPTKPGQTPAH